MTALTRRRRAAVAATVPALAMTLGLSAVGLAGPAHADPPTGSLTAIGQSICPMLVKPGATLASIASQLSGSSGLPPGIVSMVAGMAIQSQCPGMIASLANGQMPFGLQGLGGAPGLGGVPGLGGAPGLGGVPGFGGTPGLPVLNQAPAANPAPLGPWPGL
ncbi:DUF732 domain-containing protein [Mycobacterium simiae]|uniref:DUF732 domain-containing protein n=1 Tax=Mycobacterium simiae TaxID=1784 RepID=UPI0026217D81|nr:DUF732 domain-containing protein [Mycobacterium simiae]